MAEQQQSFTWFGKPWPSADERAGACENDEYRVEVPFGDRCETCGHLFVWGDQGIIIPDFAHVTWTPYHLKCLTNSVRLLAAIYEDAP